jgi:hypothetical protein
MFKNTKILLEDRELLELLTKLKIDFTQFTSDQTGQLKDLLNRYKEIFREEATITHLTEHTIDTLDANPINQAPYRRSITERNEIKKQIESMLKNNIIQASKSPWASPVVLIPKPDGSLRFCVDYRRLNEVTVRDVYPLPRIDDSLALLGNNQWYSTLDLAAGYWQCPIAAKDKTKTAFITESGLFEFNVMPFGLSNAPATFQRLMDALLAGLKWECLLVYLDDIILFAPTFEAHLLDLEETFKRIRNANLRLKSSKCHLFQKQIKYLGHIVDREGLRPDPAKIKAIIEMSVPTNHTEVRSFTGVSNYYRGYIPKFAIIMEPLYGVSQASKKFFWSRQAQESFDKIKELLSKFPILRHPDYSLPFKLQTDASDRGLGAVLSQVVNGQEHVVLYLSRTLQPADRKWSPREKEALAIIWACEKCRPYLIGVKFKVETDHHSLQWLQKVKSPARLVRWALRLSEYDFEIVYRKGLENSNADALSRLNNPEDDNIEHVIDDLITCLTMRTAVLNDFDYDMDELLQEQRRDHFSFDLIFECEKNSGFSICGQYKLVNRLLYRVENNLLLLVVPVKCREKILYFYHNTNLSVHVSRDRLHAFLKKRFYWPGLYTDVQNWVNACITCRKHKDAQPTFHGLLVPIKTYLPFQTVGIDIVGPIRRSSSQHKYILVCIDLFTNWVEAAPLRAATSEDYAHLFQIDYFKTWLSHKRLIRSRHSF